jgi:hypothetical protein
MKGMMFSGSVVVFVSAPDVPVIVTVAVPTVAVALAVSVTVLLEVVGLAPKLAVMSLGNPDADKLTLPVNPPEGVTVIVLLPLSPWVTLKLAGEAESVKFPSGAAGGKTQPLAALENSNWIVYAVPLAVYEPCWPLQMSPISP